MPPARKKPPKTPNLAALGKAVEQLRLERGLTQEEVGSFGSRDHKWFGEIERGRRNPSYEKLQELAEALGTRVGEIATLADRVRDEDGAEPHLETSDSAQTSNTKRSHSASTPRAQP